MNGLHGRWLDELAHHVWLDANAAHIADAIVSTLRGIEAVLHPVIGRGGFDALYARSLYLTGSAHPWLTVACGPVRSPVDLTVLGHLLGERSSAEAAATSVALLQTFNDLLTSLIGGSLTEQLLGSVAPPLLTLRGVAAQDTLP